MIPVKYELRSYGDRINGPVYYLVDGVEVTKNQYYLAWRENNWEALPESLDTHQQPC